MPTLCKTFLPLILTIPTETSFEPCVCISSNGLIIVIHSYVAGFLANSTHWEESPFVRTVGAIWKTTKCFLWWSSGEMLPHLFGERRYVLDSHRWEGKHHKGVRENESQVIIWYTKIRFWVFLFCCCSVALLLFYFICDTNPLIPKSDLHLTCPHKIPPESHLRVTRIKQITTNWRSSWMLNKFSLSASWEMSRGQYGEYAYWCKGV